jgi:neutral trehalase
LFSFTIRSVNSAWTLNRTSIKQSPNDLEKLNKNKPEADTPYSEDRSKNNSGHMFQSIKKSNPVRRGMSG